MKLIKILLLACLLWLPTILLGQENQQAQAAFSVLAKITHANSETGLGTIELVVSGGTAPYDYRWYGPLGYKSTKKDQIGIAPIGGRENYAVVVEDVNGNQVIKAFTLGFFKPKDKAVDDDLKAWVTRYRWVEEEK